MSKKREEYEDLAPVLWHSVGTISALLQEIVNIYPYLTPARLTKTISNRCCNALALLQCIASHPGTKAPFLNGMTASSARCCRACVCACMRRSLC